MESRKKDLTPDDTPSGEPGQQRLHNEGEDTAYADGQDAARKAFGKMGELLSKEKRAAK